MWRAGVCALVLSGCGFSPLYTERVETSLQKVEVAPSYHPDGQVVVQELRQSLVARNQGEVVLHVQVTSEVNDVLLEATTQTSRRTYVLNVFYTLREADLALTEGTARAVASYDLGESGFVNVTAREEARVRAARQVAQTVRRHLALYFSHARN